MNRTLAASATARPSVIQWLAVACILGAGGIHVGLAQDSFSEATYKGVLFLANGLGALVSAIAIARGSQRMGWLLGLCVSIGTIIGYVVSRTIGLPGIPAEPDAWFETPGVVSMVCEIAFVFLFALHGRARANPAR